MTSFKYIVTVQEPWLRCADGCGHPACQEPKPLVFEERVADNATYMARTQYARPDGTTVKIERMRLVSERIDGRGSKTHMVETGELMPYRRYEVQGGAVRRVDR